MMSKVFKILTNSWLWLAAVLVVGLVLRLYKIDGPIADWHSWRQADTAAVSRNFLKSGFDVLHPRFDDLSNIPSGKENPEGWRFVEFPIYNLLQAGLASVGPMWPLEVWGRVVSIGASLAAAVAIFLLMGRYKGRKWGVVAAGVFLTMPFNIFYSRVILPEPLAVALAMWGYWFFVKWMEEGKSGSLWASVAWWAAAILVKPVVGFLALPLAYMAVRKFGVGGVWKQGRLWLWIVLVVAPFLAWRLWMKQFPEGIPANNWLLNGDGIRFRPAWWRWIWGERVGNLMLGGWGLIPLVAGLVVRLKEEEKHLWWFFAGAVLYLVVFATGNVRHDYYQTVIVPALVVILTLGIWWFWQGVGMNKWVARFAVVACLGLGWALGWYQVKELYKVNRPEIVETGRRVDQLVPKEARVVAPYNGDTAFLYQTNRQGWPMITLPVGEMVSKLGAEYYVSVNFDADTAQVMKEYQVMEKTEKYVIVKLTKL